METLDILKIFVAGCEQVYRDVMGEAPDGRGWEGILNEAAQNGLISRIQNHIYQLHPSLPPFLRHHFVKATGEEAVRKLDAEFVKFYAELAAQLYEEVRNANQNAVSAVEIEELNFLRALRIAMRAEQWALAQNIAQTLNEFYEIPGRFREWSALRSSLLKYTGKKIRTGASRALANLWMFVLGDEANEALRENRLEGAEHSHKTIIQYLLTLSDPGAEPNIAVGYHQLGRIAEERQQFDVAEQWYRKALEIKEKIGLPPLKVDTLAQFGVLRFRQERYHESVAWFAKAYGIASAYKMPVAERIKSDLRRLLEAMGREDSVNAWREATGEGLRIDEKNQNAFY